MDPINPITIALQLAPQLPEDFTIAGMVITHLDALRHWRRDASSPQSAGNKAVSETAKD
jgi:hypothetical protein